MRFEHERRWLGDPATLSTLPLLPHHRAITDRYLACGRLRARKLVDSDGRVTLKLTKKFESDDVRALPIVTMLLSDPEHAALLVLDGYDLQKRRYFFDRGADGFSVDVFEGELEGLVTISIEAPSLDALVRIEAPPTALREVTHEPFFEGGRLCRAGRDDVRCATLAR